jgi:hypothetical protein
MYTHFLLLVSQRDLPKAWLRHLRDKRKRICIVRVELSSHLDENEGVESSSQLDEFKEGNCTLSTKRIEGSAVEPLPTGQAMITLDS